MNGDRQITDESPANTVKRDRVARKLVRRNETGLVFPSEVFSDTAIQGLVTDLVAPLIVDRLIRRAIEK